MQRRTIKEILVREIVMIERRPSKWYSASRLLRKYTTPIHWLFGVACGIMVLAFWPLSVIFMTGFALWERWNDENALTCVGDMDWWESFATYFITCIVLVALDIAGKIDIPWWGW